jgi:hypothetical protein
MTDAHNKLAILSNVCAIFTCQNRWSVRLMRRASISL